MKHRMFRCLHLDKSGKANTLVDYFIALQCNTMNIGIKQKNKLISITSCSCIFVDELNEKSIISQFVISVFFSEKDNLHFSDDLFLFLFKLKYGTPENAFSFISQEQINCLIFAFCFHFGN